MRRHTSAVRQRTSRRRASAYFMAQGVGILHDAMRGRTPWRRASAYLRAKRPIFRYSLLVLLFAITAAYEIRYFYDLLSDARREIPVFTTAVGTSRVDFLDADAARYGLHMGHEVVSVEGRPFVGIGDFFRDVDTALAKKRRQLAVAPVASTVA